MKNPQIQAELKKIDKLLALPEEQRLLQLPAAASWPQSVHLADTGSLWALKASLTARRPLLVRGLPGTGKSQLARAAAVLLGRAFLATVVNCRSECADLQYTFDAVARLGEAQALGAAGSTDQERSRQLDARNFLSPGVLWWAFNWQSAQQQAARCAAALPGSWAPDGWQPGQGCVVLIDEIDKAEADLPNGLLETLGNGSFTIPYSSAADGEEERKAAVITPRGEPPLVVITTNEERELPAAFLRRCLVLQLKLPALEADFLRCLTARGRVHCSSDFPEPVLEKAARLIWNDRQEARAGGGFVPGQAEYLDLLRALGELGSTQAEQEQALEKISAFVLGKSRQEDGH